MTIKSYAFEENQMIPFTYTCDGENKNPPLQFLDVPEGTQSLALIVDDPDAATDPNGPGKVFDHWMVWNIPPQTTEIGENINPQGANQGLNGRGAVGYTGPCPPTGTHRYFFKLYALSRKLDLSQDVSKQELLAEIDNCLVEKAQLVGLYKKEA